MTHGHRRPRPRRRRATRSPARRATPRTIDEAGITLRPSWSPPDREGPPPPPRPAPARGCPGVLAVLTRENARRSSRSRATPAGRPGRPAGAADADGPLPGPDRRLRGGRDAPGGARAPPTWCGPSTRPTARPSADLRHAGRREASRSRPEGAEDRGAATPPPPSPPRTSSRGQPTRRRSSTTTRSSSPRWPRRLARRRPSRSTCRASPSTACQNALAEQLGSSPAGARAQPLRRRRLRLQGLAAGRTSPSRRWPPAPSAVR